MKRNKIENIVLDNGRVRAVFRLEKNKVSEQYYSYNGKKPILIAESSGSSFFPCSLSVEKQKREYSNMVPDYRNNPPKGPDLLKPLLSVGIPAPIRSLRLYDYNFKKTEEDSEIELSGISSEGEEVIRTVSLRKDENNFKITNRLKLAYSSSLEFFVDHYCFAPGSHPDFTWTPSIKWDKTCISSDWTFKSPAVIIQKDSSALSIVPNITTLSKKDLKCNLGLDLDITRKPKPLVTYGFIPSMPRYHSAFIHPIGLRAGLSPGTISFSYFLLPFSNIKNRQSYRDVSSFLWRKFGHDNLIAGHASQVKPFNIWEKDAWHDLADKAWFEFDYDGEKCGAFKCSIPVASKNNALFLGWWNNLRTAYGLELYSRRTKDRKGSERAHRILNLILKAPRKEGVFPVVFIKDPSRVYWEPDHLFGGYLDSYHNFDMSWTSYWLLKWLQDLSPEDKRILPVCSAYGDFLVKNQYENGFIPSYYDEDLTVKKRFKLNKKKKKEREYAYYVSDANYSYYVNTINKAVGSKILLNEESGEPAACAVFLAELYKVTSEKKYLDAALKAIRYLEKYILPRNKWFDYETFLSCSIKSYDFYDKITGQYPQNNMCTIQTAKAILSLYDITEEKRLLDLGISVLKYLSLTQQVWSHPLLTPNLIGGFTTQNSDAEWSDARQAYCAVLYLDYFERTGNLEYLERGIAALRASFAVSPFENWAHTGFLDKGGFSGFHWGLGSGMASVEMMWERYGDVLVNLRREWAYGINGCTVERYSKKNSQIRLKIISEFEWDAPLRLVFRDVTDGNYELIINGKTVGKFESANLVNGISWFLKN